MNRVEKIILFLFFLIILGLAIVTIYYLVKENFTTGKVVFMDAPEDFPDFNKTNLSENKSFFNYNMKNYFYIYIKFI